jgi:hypothetical protein
MAQGELLRSTGGGLRVKCREGAGGSAATLLFSTGSQERAGAPLRPDSRGGFDGRSLERGRRARTQA